MLKMRERLLRMPSDFTFDESHRQIAILARQTGLKLNAYIRDTLKEKVETS